MTMTSFKSPVSQLQTENLGYTKLKSTKVTFDRLTFVLGGGHNFGWLFWKEEVITFPKIKKSEKIINGKIFFFSSQGCIRPPKSSYFKVSVGVFWSKNGFRKVMFRSRWPTSCWSFLFKLWQLVVLTCSKCCANMKSLAQL